MKKTQSAWRFFIDVLYPNRCPFCDGFIGYNEYVCPECEPPVINAEICRKCGKIVCACTKNPRAYDKVYVCYEYAAAAPGILPLKSGGNTNFACHGGELLGAFIYENEHETKADIIIPVPMPFKRRVQRGYNQTEIIAARISEKTGAPCNKRILFRKNSAAQHILTEEERRLNAESFYGGEYEKNIKEISGKKIILCDDVLTTGNTAEKCAEILKSMGAETVILAVIATTCTKKEKNTEEEAKKNGE